MIILCFSNTKKMTQDILNYFHRDLYNCVVIMNIFTIVISAAIVAANGYLICFHIYLKIKGMNTYDHILYKRNINKFKNARKVVVSPNLEFEKNSIR